MIYLKTFKLSNRKISDDNIYPYSVLKNKKTDIFVLTVLYGNNGCRKIGKYLIHISNIRFTCFFNPS